MKKRRPKFGRRFFAANYAALLRAEQVSGIFQKKSDVLPSLREQLENGII